MEPGDLIALARRRAGLTQAALAERAGTSQPVISAYEHGRRDPSLHTLQRLIEAAGERLHVSAIPAPTSDIVPPADLEAHGRRLLDVLSIADAIPHRARSTVLRAPRLVSR
jgi:transcriptional regulator with XRE-family HTH domain